MRDRKDVQAVLKNGKKYLIVKKEGEWRLLKGGVEKGEREEEALRREIEEEVGIKNIKIKGKIGYYDYKAEGVHHKVHSYFVETDQKKLEVFKKELEEARWVKPKKLLRMLEYENEREIVKEVINGCVL